MHGLIRFSHIYKTENMLYFVEKIYVLFTLVKIQIKSSIMTVRPNILKNIVAMIFLLKNKHVSLTVNTKSEDNTFC